MDRTASSVPNFTWVKSYGEGVAAEYLCHLLFSQLQTTGFKSFTHRESERGGGLGLGW